MKDWSDTFYPYGRQRIDEDDVAAVTDVLRGEYLTSGPAVAEFEKALAEQVGARFAVACSSGTAALHLGVMALGLGPECTVIVPTMTFLATPNAARFVDAEVIFCDVDPDTGLLNESSLQLAISKASDRNVNAVLPVHLNGQCVDMEMLAGFASAHDFRIIEDGCHALGSVCQTSSGQKFSTGSCTHSDLCTFSFHPVKTIAMGEGGAVTTNDEHLYLRLLKFRNHGMVRDPDDWNNEDLAFDENHGVNPWYYEMSEIGFNYRASDIHCALGLSQLGKLERFVSQRRKLVEIYDALIDHLRPAVKPVTRVPNCKPAWHIYSILIDFERFSVTRAELMHRLKRSGVGTQVHYIPVHKQPYYSSRYGEISLPGAEAYYQRQLTLPLFPGMEQKDVEKIVSILEKSLV